MNAMTVNDVIAVPCHECNSEDAVNSPVISLSGPTTADNSFPFPISPLSLLIMMVHINRCGVNISRISSILRRGRAERDREDLGRWGVECVRALWTEGRRGERDEV